MFDVKEYPSYFLLEVGVNKATKPEDIASREAFYKQMYKDIKSGRRNRHTLGLESSILAPVNLANVKSKGTTPLTVLALQSALATKEQAFIRLFIQPKIVELTSGVQVTAFKPYAQILRLYRGLGPLNQEAWEEDYGGQCKPSSFYASLDIESPHIDQIDNTLAFDVLSDPAIWASIGLIDYRATEDYKKALSAIKIYNTMAGSEAEKQTTKEYKDYLEADERIRLCDNCFIHEDPEALIQYLEKMHQEWQMPFFHYSERIKIQYQIEHIPPYNLPITMGYNTQKGLREYNKNFANGLKCIKEEAQGQVQPEVQEEVQAEAKDKKGAPKK